MIDEPVLENSANNDISKQSEIKSAQTVNITTSANTSVDTNNTTNNPTFSSTDKATSSPTQPEVSLVTPNEPDTTSSQNESSETATSSITTPRVTPNKSKQHTNNDELNKNLEALRQSVDNQKAKEASKIKEAIELSEQSKASENSYTQTNNQLFNESDNPIDHQPPHYDNFNPDFNGFDISNDIPEPPAYLSIPNDDLFAQTTQVSNNKTIDNKNIDNNELDNHRLDNQQNSESVNDLFSINENTVDTKTNEPNQINDIPANSQTSNVQPKVLANINTQEVVDNPLTLLHCPKVELDGEWTLEKWDYWIEQANLIPAEFNLATKGVMTGDITGKSVFKISNNLEKLTNEFFERLTQTLKQFWADTDYSVSLVEDTLTTPEQQKSQRYDNALAAVCQKMMQEPIVIQLQNQFNATVTDIQMNEQIASLNAITEN